VLYCTELHCTVQHCAVVYFTHDLMHALLDELHPDTHRTVSYSKGCVCEGTKPAHVTLIGNIIVGMFLVLPTESSQSSDGGLSLQKQGAMVFKAIIYGESELCIPFAGEGVEDRTRQKRRLAAVELLGALIGTRSYVNVDI
jgi:hypothetical protein